MQSAGVRDASAACRKRWFFGVCHAKRVVGLPVAGRPPPATFRGGMRHRSVQRTYFRFNVVTGAFRAIGESGSWGTGGVPGTAGLRTLPAAASRTPACRPGPPAATGLAIGGTCEQDAYQLPNAMVDLVLRHQGWMTQNLGTGLPFSTLAAAIEHDRPQLFWLSVSHIADEEAFLHGCTLVAQVCRPDVRFVVGGRASARTLWTA